MSGLFLLTEATPFHISIFRECLLYAMTTIGQWGVMTACEIDTIKARLPKRPGIQDEERFFKSAVLLPLVSQQGECYVLFQKRAHHIRQGGEVSFPGGRYDPEVDRSYKDTALRETVEELGIAREQITLLGALDVVVSPQRVIVAPFVGLLQIDAVEELAFDRNEVEKVFLVPLSYFKQTEPERYEVRVEIQASYVDENGVEQVLLPAEELGLPERYFRTWGGNRYHVLVYPEGEEIVWGITAGIMRDFVMRLQYDTHEETDEGGTSPNAFSI